MREFARACVSLRVRVCVFARVRAHVCMHVRVPVREHARVCVEWRMCASLFCSAITEQG